MTSIPVALLLLAAVALGFWLENRPGAPPRIRFSGPPTLADCLRRESRRVRPLKGVRRG